MKKYFKENWFYVLVSVIAIVAMWLVWVIVYHAVGNEYVIPSFTESIKSFGLLFVSTTFWTAFGMTCLRMILAFLISFVLAALLCMLAASVKAIEAFLKPVMIFFRTLPTLAIILVILIWTNATIAPVIVTVLVLFPAMYAQMMAAVNDVDKGLVQMADVYRVSRGTRISKIYLPLVAPNILSQCGPNISLGLKVTVSAEVMANTLRSIGGMMQNARTYVDMPKLAALTLITVIVGIIIEFAFSFTKRIWRRWREEDANA
ncbi:MAG: ABC transporter permease subunit [Clostridia bacterium]|nr:ABC transporter permease subunit [Clostridia bacterium]